MTIKLSPSDIVTVACSDKPMSGFQGEVIAVSGDSADVEFPEHTQYMFGVGINRRARFKAGDLKKDEGWTVKNEAVHLFGGSFRSLHKLKRPFNSEAECAHEACTEQVFKRALVHFWGSVYEVDLCQEHADTFHGETGEHFPFSL